MIARRHAHAIATAAFLVATHAAAAGGDRSAAAQSLFDHGKALVEQGRFAEACPELQESQRLDPGIGTLLWLADCYENNGQTATAWTSFKAAADAAAARHDDRQKVARDRATALESRLSRLMIIVPQGASATNIEVRRDGAAVDRGEWGLAVPLDPGVHAIEVSASGHQPWSATVQLEARPVTLPITVPELEREHAALAPRALPEARPASPSSVASIAKPPSTGLGPQRITGIAVAGAGAAGLIAGTIVALGAKATYDASNAGHCLPDNECDATGQRYRADATSAANAATVVFGASAAAAALGVVLYLTAPRRDAVVVAAAPGSLRVSYAW